MAASSPSSSISSSDSDLEPNSKGARVFWGNVKTPEKSNVGFVNPPKTVVRSHPPARRKSARLSILRQTHDPSPISSNSLDEIRLVQDNPFLDMHKSVGNEYSMSHGSIEKESAPSSPFFEPVSTRTSSPRSLLPSASPKQLVGNDVERGIARTCSPIDAQNTANDAFKTVMDSQHLPDVHRKPVTSIAEQDIIATPDCPDLISFETPSPAKLSIATSRDTSKLRASPIPSATSLSSTSSYMAVDDMLSSELNPFDEGHTVEVSVATGETKQSSPPENYTNPNTQSVMLIVDSQADNGDISSYPEPSKCTTMQVDATELSSTPIPLDTPKVAVDPLSSGRSSPLKDGKRKERTLDVAISGLSPTRMRTSPLPEEMSEADRLAKIERRTKAKRDTERQRQQLLSLSPTSVDILDLLASPPKESPKQGVDSMMARDDASQVVTEGNVDTNMDESPSPARRVLIEMLSPHRGPPSRVRFMRPTPTSLDDPNRTPAKRILVSPSLPKPLPLNDSNRIPARRVLIASSPVNSTPFTLPKFKFNSASPTKPTKPTSLAPNKQSPYKTLAGASPSKVLPSFSQSVLDNTSRGAEVSTNLSTLKILPATRHITPSRLPIPSTSRRIRSPSPSASFTPSNVAGSSKPSRIPSPIKRQTFVQGASRTPVILPSAPSSSKVTLAPNTWSQASRKRQRDLSDSDSDERPSKRPVTVVRTVVPGMFNKVSRPPQRNDAFSISSHKMNHPVLPSEVNSSERSTSANSTSSSSALKDRLYQAELSSTTAEEGTSPVGTASTLSLSREPTLDDVAFSGQESVLSEPPPIQQTELRRTARIRRPPTPDPFIASGGTTAAPPTAIFPKRGSSRVLRPEATIRPASRTSTRSPTPNKQFLDSPRRLHTLTTNNTIRNQAIVADLERTVIRKSGPRPPSPTSRVRNRDKSKEELSKEREWRAERRRRRSDMGSSDLEDLDRNSLSSPPRKPHSWGQGDDEDYETPDRPPQPSRWNPTKLAKGVKWSRTLVQTIILWDEEGNKSEASVPQPELKPGNRRKSCLLREAASIKLDDFGNVLDATEPVPNLERERIVVTKLVYDTDIEEEEPFPRTTRRKKS